VKRNGRQEKSRCKEESSKEENSQKEKEITFSAVLKLRLSRSQKTGQLFF
jgi:hypothetical protein